MLNLSEYLDGQKLYGDDFSLEQIKQWYEDEKEAYFNLISNNKNSYQYGYSLLNYEHGFRFLPDKRFPQVLSIGGAYGEELSLIKDRAGQITILESSDDFVNSDCPKNHHMKYMQAQPNGKMPFPNNYFNLITCFGTLYHIPNVSTVQG